MFCMPDFTQFMQEMTSKDQKIEVPEQRSARLSDLGSLTRASSSKQLVCTLSRRLLHTSEEMLCSLKRVNGRLSDLVLESSRIARLLLAFHMLKRSLSVAVG